MLKRQSNNTELDIHLILIPTAATWTVQFSYSSIHFSKVTKSALKLYMNVHPWIEPMTLAWLAPQPSEL